MADKNDKVARNVAGKYYVDSTCISCNSCVDIAGDYFEEDQDAGWMYVKAQPDSPESIALCEEALSHCPVDAIGNDGE